VAFSKYATGGFLIPNKALHNTGKLHTTLLDYLLTVVFHLQTILLGKDTLKISIFYDRKRLQHSRFDCGKSVMNIYLNTLYLMSFIIFLSFEFSLTGYYLCFG